MVNENTEISSERRPTLSCISKDLYDSSPQSRLFFIQWYYEVLHYILIFVSKFTIGQFFLTIFDSYFVKVEKTLDFMVPKHPTLEAVVEDHAQNLTASDRPMTWILFIPALITLRIIRFWLSAASILIGRGEVTAKDLQMKIMEFRRYYRSVRHYAVDCFSEVDWTRRNERVSESIIWFALYKSYELVFMTKPPVEYHSDNLPEVTNGSAVVASSTPSTSSSSTPSVISNETRRPSSNVAISRNSNVNNGIHSSTDKTVGSSDKSSSKRASVSSTDELVVNGNEISKASKKSFDATSSNGKVSPTTELASDIQNTSMTGETTQQLLMIENGKVYQNGQPGDESLQSNVDISAATMSSSPKNNSQANLSAMWESESYIN